MSDSKKENIMTDQFAGDWMDAASQFWQNAFKFQNEAMQIFAGFTEYLNNTSLKSGDMLNMGSTINKFAVSFFNKPENLDAFSNDSDTLPLLIMNMSHNLTASFNDLQNKLMEQSSRFGSKFKEFNIEEMDTGIFDIWQELYKTDFQKFYNIPQLGIARTTRISSIQLWIQATVIIWLLSNS